MKLPIYSLFSTCTKVQHKNDIFSQHFWKAENEQQKIQIKTNTKIDPENFFEKYQFFYPECRFFSQDRKK